MLPPRLPGSGDCPVKIVNVLNGADVSVLSIRSTLPENELAVNVSKYGAEGPVPTSGVVKFTVVALRAGAIRRTRHIEFM